MFEEWLSIIKQKYKNAKLYAGSFIDNRSAHNIILNHQAVKKKILLPNTTLKFPSLNRRVMKTIKTHYRK